MSGQDSTPTPGANAKVKEVLFPSRKTPARATTQSEHVRDRKYGGNTAAMAAAYNVTPRTVGRWIDGTRTPRGSNAAQLREEATEVQTTARGRERRAREMEKRDRQGLPSGYGATVNRATSFDIQGSSALRSRDIPIDLTSSQVAKLARTMDEAEIEVVIAEGIATYMNGGRVSGGFSPSDFTFNINDVTFKGM
ncbi:hypothetical protein OG883_44710 [Streptomyces sp. NBC_01142]|uniref:hypothetical protein n=1 Tax=Streptomyces sp. NBC_01142 TaxID=2975865 RepID=UPI002251A3E5|nr:hypothetical protein [Streptomyces sp. NBC_01142]MCX4826748.1 hypothetical protein [Streptomyces sp. NBC_01142]